MLHSYVGLLEGKAPPGFGGVGGVGGFGGENPKIALVGFCSDMLTVKIKKSHFCIH